MAVELKVLLLAVLHAEDGVVCARVLVVDDAQLLDLVRVVLAAVAGRARHLGVVVVLRRDAALGPARRVEVGALAQGGVVAVGRVGDRGVGGRVEDEPIRPVGGLLLDDLGRHLAG